MNIIKIPWSIGSPITLESIPYLPNLPVATLTQFMSCLSIVQSTWFQDCTCAHRVGLPSIHISSLPSTLFPHQLFHPPHHWLSHLPSAHEFNSCQFIYTINFPAIQGLAESNAGGRIYLGSKMRAMCMFVARASSTLSNGSSTPVFDKAIDNSIKRLGLKPVTNLHS
jgi:hypothetical protein